MRVLILDGHNLIHRARAGYHRGDHSVTFMFFRSLRPLVEKMNPDKVYFVLEGSPKKRIATDANYKANRKIGGDAPSQYLPRIQQEKQVGLSDDEMNALLASHAIAPQLLRADEFKHFIEDRRRRLAALIEKAMGKQVNQAFENEEYDTEALEQFAE